MRTAQAPRSRQDDWARPLLKNRDKGGGRCNHLLKLTFGGLRIDGVLILRTNVKPEIRDLSGINVTFVAFYVINVRVTTDPI
jgi:hypothetical protein